MHTLTKVLVVGGALLFNGIGARRDITSTQRALGAGAVEVGHPTAANVMTGVTSGACLVSLAKSVSVGRALLLCSPVIGSGAVRNFAANSNNRLAAQLAGKK